MPDSTSFYRCVRNVSAVASAIAIQHAAVNHRKICSGNFCIHFSKTVSQQADFISEKITFTAQQINQDVKVSSNVVNLGTNDVYVRLYQQDDNSNWVELDEQIATTSTTLELKGTTANTNNLKIVYSSLNGNFKVKNVLYNVTEMLAMNYMDKICNTDEDFKDDYRFGFNGIEKANEVAGIGKHYTALFGEYDPRTVYRWNTDPKPFPSISPYAMFNGNPIWFNDPLLDVFKIANGANATQEKADVMSMTVGTTAKGKKTDGSKYVEFAEDGTVSLNFGNMKQEKIDQLLKDNIGLGLINDLVNAKDEGGNDINFLYTANDNQQFTDAKDPSKTFVPQYLNGDGSPSLGMPRTTSTTPKFLNGGLYRNGKVASTDENMKPLAGFQGMINVPASLGFMGWRAPFLNVRRASIVYHEIRENYYRTVFKLPYAVPAPVAPNSSKSFIQGHWGAHNKSVLDEGLFYGNPDPGGYLKAVKVK